MTTNQGLDTGLKSGVEQASATPWQASQRRTEIITALVEGLPAERANMVYDAFGMAKRAPEEPVSVAAQVKRRLTGDDRGDLQRMALNARALVEGHEQLLQQDYEVAVAADRAEAQAEVERLMAIIELCTVAERPGFIVKAAGEHWGVEQTRSFLIGVTAAHDAQFAVDATRHEPVAGAADGQLSEETLQHIYETANRNIPGYQYER